jgi:hypothetical protein
MRSTLLICATALTCLTIAAQSTKKATRPVPKETQLQVQDAYSNTGFDPTLARLPAGFRGHDIQALSSELKSADSAKKKGEFESTEQWAERLRLAEGRPILGTLTHNSTYAFLIGQNYSEFSSGIKIDYDADAARFDISAEAEPPIYFSERDKPGGVLSLPIWTGRPDSGAYIGSNGFGAVREVTEYSSREYKLIIVNSAAFPFIDIPVWKLLGFKQIRGEVSASPAIARDVKSQIHLLAVCKLAPPYVTSGWSNREATLDNPVSRNITYTYVHVDLEAVWIYNQETGEV